MGRSKVKRKKTVQILTKTTTIGAIKFTEDKIDFKAHSIIEDKGGLFYTIIFKTLN